MFKQFIRNVGYYPEGTISSVHQMPKVETRSFFIPKRVVLSPGEEIGILESPGEIFFSNYPCSPCHPAPGLCTLGTRCIFEHISWLMPCASHLPHDFANCPKVHLCFLQFSQLPAGGKRYQLEPCSPLQQRQETLVALCSGQTSLISPCTHTRHH